MKTFAAVVVLYNPDSRVYSRIKTYADQVAKVYLIDNSEERTNLDLPSHKWEYYFDGVNKGIATRLNQAAFWCIRDGVDWLLMMDQDSEFDPDNIKAYISCVENFPGGENVSLFGPVFEPTSSLKPDCSYQNATNLITSGSVLNLKIFQDIGGFHEELFIDQVDFDYCYRSLLQNKQIVQFDHIQLIHSIGNTSIHKSLKSFSATSRSLHTPVRLYYMTRNYFYVKAKYKSSFPSEIQHSKKDLLYRIKNNFLYGKNKLGVLKFVVRGWLDFRRQKMGKYQ